MSRMVTKFFFFTIKFRIFILLDSPSFLFFLKIGTITTMITLNLVVRLQQEAIAIVLVQMITSVFITSLHTQLLLKLPLVIMKRHHATDDSLSTNFGHLFPLNS